MERKEFVTDWPPLQRDEPPPSKKFKLITKPTAVDSEVTIGAEPRTVRTISKREFQLVHSPVDIGCDRLLAQWLKWKRSCSCGSHDLELSQLPTSTNPNTLLHNLTKYVCVCDTVVIVVM